MVNPFIICDNGNWLIIQRLFLTLAQCPLKAGLRCRRRHALLPCDRSSARPGPCPPLPGPLNPEGSTSLRGQGCLSCKPARLTDPPPAPATSPAQTPCREVRRQARPG